jgi:hypothetical protein
MSKKSYSVVLNSTNKISSGASLSDCRFGMNWGILPEGEYEVHFTFISKVMNLSTTDIACINVNLGSSNVFQAGANTSANTLNFIGIAKPYLVSTTAYLLSEDNTNPPIFLNGRPRDNFIDVHIKLNDNVTLFAPTTGSMVDWILQLYFTQV